MNIQGHSTLQPLFTKTAFPLNLHSPPHLEQSHSVSSSKVILHWTKHPALPNLYLYHLYFDPRDKVTHNCSFSPFNFFKPCPTAQIHPEMQKTPSVTTSVYSTNYSITQPTPLEKICAYRCIFQTTQTAALQARSSPTCLLSTDITIKKNRI